jgi:AcrR family transcriptional regulator
MPAPISAKAQASIDARKQRTRQALKNTALKLFAAKGYDATSTEEIAEKAGVSWRTFFRHFPTKELVLLGGRGIWFDTLAELSRYQPAAMNDLEAVHAALIELSPSLEERRTSLCLYEKSIASSPLLRGVRQDYHETSIKLLAKAIARRRGRRSPDESCTLLATMCVLIIQRALERWVAAPAGVKLRDIFTQSFEALNGAFGDLPRSAQLRSNAARIASSRTLNVLDF